MATVHDWGEKDPAEELHLGVDMSTAMKPGDSIDTAVWTFINQAGCTKALEGIDGTVARFECAAGNVGETMRMLLTVNTVDGEKLKEVCKLKIKAKQ
jgi:hypothetical protein